MKKILLPAILIWPVLAPAQTKLTIYNQGFAAVSEPVVLNLPRTETIIWLTNVSALIQEESLALCCSTNPDAFKIIEQEYNTRPINEIQLLQLCEGKWLDFEYTNPLSNERRLIRARLVRAPGLGAPHRQVQPWEPIVETDGKVRFELPGRPLFDPALVSGPIKPTITWRLRPKTPGKFGCTLSYITMGIQWQATYRINLAADTGTCSVTCNATIENSTGRDYQNAQIALLAGEVFKLAPGPAPRLVPRSAVLASTADGETVPEPEREFEYYRFQLPQPVTLQDGQQKSYELFRAPNVRVETTYRFESPRYVPLVPGQVQPRQHAVIWLETTNHNATGLGTPLPAGNALVFSTDADGHPTLLGETKVPAIPIDATLRMPVGRAFDVSMTRRIVSIARPPDQASGVLPRQRTENTVELVINNAKPEPVQVQIFETLDSTPWKITAQSHPWKKRDATSIMFEPRVPARGSVTITYTVRYGEQ